MADKMDILLKEYDTLNDLFAATVEGYKGQTKHLSFYLSIFAAIGVYVFSNDKIKLEPGGIQYVYLVTLFTSIIICFYLLANLLDSLYHCFLIETRIGIIEERINIEAGEDILIYRSKIISHFHEVTFYGYKKWINPAFLVAGLIGLLLFVIVLCHCLLFYKIIESYSMLNEPINDFMFVLFYFYFLFSAFGSFFVSYQFYMLNTVGTTYMKSKIKNFSSLSEAGYEFNKTLKNNYNFKVIPILTFVSGFLIFVVFSIKNNYFWFTSDCDLPLIGNFSVMFGDSILLPIINYRIFNLAFNRFGIASLKSQKVNFVYIVIVVLLLSTIGNFLIHYYWVNDFFTTFVSVNKFSLTFVGKLHLIFSIIQLSIIFLFYYLWLLSFKLHDKKIINYAHKTGLFILIFSMLSFLDFGFKYFYLLNNNFISELLENHFGFFTTFVSLCLIFISGILKRRSNV